MFAFFAWVGCAVMVGFIDKERGRNGIGWAMLAMLTSPVLAGIALFLTPRREGRSLMCYHEILALNPRRVL